MTYSCFIACFRSPVTGVFLNEWIALLTRKDMAGSLVETTNMIGFLFHNKALVLSYLQMNNKRKEGLFQNPSFSLQINLLSPELNLFSALIEHKNKSKEYPEEFTEILSLTCRTFFSSDNRIPSFLFGCISSIGWKFPILIHTDIIAHWTLKDVSSILWMSTSLLKKNLKNEGTTFSCIILNVSMQITKNLLAFKKYSIAQLVEFHSLSISILIGKDIIQLCNILAYDISIYSKKMDKQKHIIFLLTLFGGFCDASTFILLGIFSGHITGNSVLVMIYLVERNWIMFIYCSVSLLAFLSGTTMGNLWRLYCQAYNSYSLVMPLLFLQAVLLISGSVLWLASSCVGFIVCQSLSMGLQNGVIMNIRDIRIHTTYISGMSTTLINSLLRKQLSEKKMLHRILSIEILFFIIGALFGGLLTSKLAINGMFFSLPLLFISGIISYRINYSVSTKNKL